MSYNFNNEELKSKTHSEDFIPSFIRKTYDILEEALFPQFIDWNLEGTAIVIKKPSEFSQKVLPVYFKHNNFTSFVRQLNMYDFHKRRTQGVDHVYFHDLFVKGKRQLLSQIKRKTHDNTAEKNQKTPESQNSPQVGGGDIANLVNENQFFKRLYNEAMSRLSVLERQAKELAMQNQSLWCHVNRKSDSDKAFRPSIIRLESQSDLTLDQLPMTLGKMPLNFNAAYKTPVQTSVEQYTKSSGYFGNRNDYLNLGDEYSGTSTVSSRNSPLVSSEPESDGYFGDFNCDSEPQFSKGNPYQNLNVSKEMSVGQMLEAWNFELANDDMLCFADQKVDRPSVNTQAVCQDKSVLGKRQFDSENQHGDSLEPSMRRHELPSFNKKNVMNYVGDDKDIIDAMYYGNTAAVGGYDLNMGIDLMDF